MSYRFEPTGEVRVPTTGDWYLDEVGLAMCYGKEFVEYPIFRRVPHEDTSCEVAFARMCCAYKSFEHQHDGAVHALYKRMCDGERSPELTAAMQALTEKMKGST